MGTTGSGATETDSVGREIARLALERDVTVAVAESLTGGAVSAALAKAPDASRWYAGSVTAYLDATKFRVLGVPKGPVVTAACARAMAEGARSLLAADVVVALTGVGGPDDEEGHPPGTTFIGVATSNGVRHHEYRFDGAPDDVVAQAVERALELIVDAIAMKV